MSAARNNKIKEKDRRLVCVVTDWLTSFLAFLGFDIFRFYYMGLGDEFYELTVYLLAPKLIFEQFAVPTLLLGVYWLSGYYNKPLERSRLNEFLVTFYSQLFNAVLIYLLALTNDQFYMRRESWMLLIVLFLLLFVFTYIGRLCVTASTIKRIRRYNKGPVTVIVGVSTEALKLAERLKNNESSLSGTFKGFMPFGNEKIPENLPSSLEDASIIKDIDHLIELCREKSIEQVIIVPPSGKSPIKKILFFLYNLYPYDVAIRINPDLLSIITPSIRLQDILGEPFIDLSSPQTSEFSKNMKRSIDVAVALTGLLALSPLYGILSVAVKLSGPGKIIYRQQRIGLHRKPFHILKFRSMVEDAEKDGVPLLSSDTDKRITGVGKWMRKYRLDELPQLWNVLKGDMSLVGPRPEREYFIDKIIKKAPWYTLVLQVRPGITSWGMVKYGYATSVEQMIERNRFDLIYLANMSVALDFKILIHTVKTVSSGEGK